MQAGGGRLLAWNQGQARLAVAALEVLRLHRQAQVLGLEPAVDAVGIVGAHRVAGLAAAVEAHQGFAEAEIHDQAQGRCIGDGKILPPTVRGAVDGVVVAPGLKRATDLPAIGVGPLVAVQLAPLPGLAVGAQQLLAGADGGCQAAGEDGWLVFLLRGARIVPEPCLLYTSPSPRDRQKSRMPSSA